VLHLIFNIIVGIVRQIWRPIGWCLTFMSDIKKSIQALQNFAQNHLLSGDVLYALSAEF